MNALGSDEQVLTFRTNVGDIVEAGNDNPLRFVTVEENDGIKPYVLVRVDLKRYWQDQSCMNSFRMVKKSKLMAVLMFAVRSKGVVFPIMPADELARLSA